MALARAATASRGVAGAAARCGAPRPGAEALLFLANRAQLSQRRRGLCSTAAAASQQQQQQQQHGAAASAASPLSRVLGLVAGVAAGAALTSLLFNKTDNNDDSSTAANPAAAATTNTATANPAEEDVTEIVNWSATHAARPQRYVEPATLAELEAAVAAAHASGQRLRPVGAAISPNGLGLSDEGMLSLSQLDEVLWVDREARLVRVQAGARVQQVVEALRPHGLTLENYASIKWQMIGGYTQTGAHGTGATLPPVDEQVVSMKLVTPAEGTLELSAEHEPALFHLARVGLGGLGVVAELTLRCVPAHRLVETTRVLTRAEVRRGHAQRLRRHRHVRYMWIPYEDAVVVVTCDPLVEASGGSGGSGNGGNGGNGGGGSKDEDAAPPVTARVDSGYALEPLRALLRKTEGVAEGSAATDAIDALNFAALRDRLLASAPLDVAHVRACNRAEAEFWRRSQAFSKVDWSDQILGFECGGQQWVNEVALPAGSLQAPSLRDIDFVESLLEKLEAMQTPAPAPIEQRWTAASASAMSPAHPPAGAGDSEKAGGGSAAAGGGSAAAGGGSPIYSWVGIIMYLCTEDPQQRQAITDAFAAYRGIVARELDGPFDAYVHWAKLEAPADAAGRAALAQRLAARYPMRAYVAAQRRLDPKGVLSNDALRVFVSGGL